MNAARCCCCLAGGKRERLLAPAAGAGGTGGGLPAREKPCCCCCHGAAAVAVVVIGAVPAAPAAAPAPVPAPAPAGVSSDCEPRALSAENRRWMVFGGRPKPFAFAAAVAWLRAAKAGPERGERDKKVFKVRKKKYGC